MVVALVLRRSVTKGAASRASSWNCPSTRCRRCSDLAIGLWQRAWIFLRRAGTIIFTVTVVLWLLLNFPRAAPGERPGRRLDRRHVGQRPRRGGRADRLQPRHRARADPGDGGARGGGVLAGDDLCGRSASDEDARPRRSSATSSRPAGACRPRSPSSPGSSSRRSACRPSPSPGAKRTGGNGRRSCCLPVRIGLHLRRNHLLERGRARTCSNRRANSWQAASTRSS